MKTEIFALCEYASDKDGRLTIVDTFDSIKAEKFPWRAYFYLALKVSDLPETANQHKFAIQILDPDNNEIFRTEDTVSYPANTAKFTLVAGFKGLILNQAGTHQVNIIIDNIINKYPLVVLQ